MDLKAFMFPLTVGEINAPLCAECGMRPAVEQITAILEVSLQFTWTLP